MTHRVWIDWLKEIGKRIDDLRDPSLIIEDKKGFLQGVVDRIDVKNLDNQTYELKIGFTFPYVGDTLVKETPNGTPSKSRVKDGKKIKRVKVNLLKKPMGYDASNLII